MFSLAELALTFHLILTNIHNLIKVVFGKRTFSIKSIQKWNLPLPGNRNNIKNIYANINILLEITLYLIAQCQVLWIFNLFCYDNHLMA